MIKADLFSHSLEEAMTEIRVKTQEAGAHVRSWSPGKQFQLPNPCTSSEVLGTMTQSGWVPLAVVGAQAHAVGVLWRSEDNTNGIQTDLGLNPGFDIY